MFKASNGMVVSFKSIYQGESDYMVYDRAEHAEHRVRVSSIGHFVDCSGRSPSEAEKAAVGEFRHYRDANDGN